jgi:hypothetical protein
MQVQCSKCSRSLAVTDVVHLVDGRLAHVECSRPSTLTPEERQLVFLYCSGHAVAHCASCDARFRFGELGSDMLGSHTNICPRCRRDLTETIRLHLYGCAMLPSEVRTRARAVREAAQNLVKQSQRLVDRADVLMREAEAALLERQRALRDAMAMRASRPARPAV